MSGTLGAAPRRPRVLLVGAYERDNLGDLLFLLVTERYLRDADVVAAAPFSADMRALLGRRVHAYGPLLRELPFDAIWTVGGQVGRVDLAGAYRMAVHPLAWRRYVLSPPGWRERILHRAAGGIAVAAPYIPAPGPLSAGAVTIVNSAGLSGIAEVEPWRRSEIVAQLRAATSVTVRDRRSSRVLTQHAIDHWLAPDAVHALGVLEPALRDPDADVAIVQVSAAVLRELGHADVAAAIAHSPVLAKLRIRLLAAGTATGHDSFRDLERLVRLIRRAGGRRIDAAIVRERRPLELVALIRRSRVVIGTSLHVRVIACAYGLPRVSLAKPKPTHYARQWDPGMPYGIRPPALDAAVRAALLRADDPAAADHSARLARRADAHLSQLARIVARTTAPRRALAR